jgi:hypothetical protein
MSHTPPPTDPTQYVSAQPTTSTTNIPNQWTRLAFTILPFVVYLLAQRITLPTYHVLDRKGMRDWSDSDNIVAVGIMPWIIAAVMVEIVTFVVAGGQRLRHEGAMGRAELHRATNIFGLLVAVVHASWITWDVSVRGPSFLHIGIFDPSVDPFLPNPYVSSPILAFGALMAGAIGLKWLVDFVGPRSFLGGHGRALAAGLLLSTIYTITRENSPFDTLDVQFTAFVRIAVNLLECGMLVSFILLKPQFLPQRAIAA